MRPFGPNPRRVRGLPGLARELDLLRARAAVGTMKAKVSLEDLVQSVRLPRSTLYSYLTGKTLAPSDVLDRIVVALGAEPEEQREWSEAWFRVHAGDDQPVRAPFTLPPVVRGFTGRVAELTALDRLLASAVRSDAGLGIAAVCGPAGVGKTALGLRWAHRVRDRFPDGCLYVDLRGRSRPLAPSRALGVLLGCVGEEAPSDVAVRSARYRDRLDGRRMLVLLDDAACADQVRPLLPGSSTCVVVVTSRDDLAGLVTRDGAGRIGLGPLPTPDAVALLGSLLGAQPSPADRTAAVELAERCGRLPGALREAAEVVSTHGA
ncbi:helix-turn-helix domain-containing protein [Actinosynnema sp. NPDC020468]|uniref:helix-turn-helix domain-containing protein n=1 Tax=Actinosynnema sp. NPDC020468 TaxID=3154488 RepID=UPI0033F8123C